MNRLKEPKQLRASEIPLHRMAETNGRSCKNISPLEDRKSNVDNYKSPFPLLDDTYNALQLAAVEDSKLRAAHSENGDGYWPSAASIVFPTTSKGGLMYDRVEGACLRQVSYKMLRLPETDATSPRSIKAMTIGTVTEDIFKEWFHAVNCYRVVYPDVRGHKLRFNSMRDGIRVRGEVDMIVEHTETGVRFGVEVKTYDGSISAANLCGPERAKEAYKTWIPPDYIDEKSPFPKSSNLLQTMLYLQEFWNDGIHLWKIIYGARDKGPDTEFDVTLADHNGKRCAVVNGVVQPEYSIEAIYERFNELRSHVEASTLPPRDYVPEYDPDYLLTGQISINHGSKHPKTVTAHQLWKEKIDSRFAKMKTPKSGKKKTQDQVYRDAMATEKGDWQCNYCPFRERCVTEIGDQAIF